MVFACGCLNYNCVPNPCGSRAGATCSSKKNEKEKRKEEEDIMWTNIFDFSGLVSFDGLHDYAFFLK